MNNMNARIIRTAGQLAPVLKELRRQLGLSQAALGRKIGLSQERISRIENDPESVSLDHLLTVLMALDAEIMVGPRTGSRKNGDAPQREDW